MSEQPLNDNELKGLPRDIDLLETAIAALKRKPEDTRRRQHFKSIMARVGAQLKDYN